MKNYTKIIFFILSCLFMISTVALFVLGSDWIIKTFNTNTILMKIEDENISVFIKNNQDWFRIGSIISFVLLFINFFYFFAFKLKTFIKK